LLKRVLFAFASFDPKYEGASGSIVHDPFAPRSWIF